MDLAITLFFVGTLMASSLVGFLIRLDLCHDEKRKLKKDTAEEYKIRNDTVQSSACSGDSSPENGSGTDVIIVGAGVAGAALAYTLGKDGRRVHVIERDLREPDRIVGEVLHPGGYLKLVELGLEDCLEEIDAHRVTGYAFFKDGKSTRVPYPSDKYHGNIAGKSFHNGRFIRRMREKAATLSNVRLVQGTVTHLLKEHGTVKGVQYKTKDGQELRTYAPLTIVCDGGYSNLRQSLCISKVDILSCCVALVLEKCVLPFPNHVHAILADPSAIIFYRISSTEVRCMIDVPSPKVPSIANSEMAGYLKSMVAPQIPPELHDAFISAVDKGNIRTLSNKTMPAAPMHTPGAIMLGDAFNMRHPLTGGGMTVALSDVLLLKTLLKPLHEFQDSASLSNHIESFYTLRKPMAFTINVIADVTHRVVSASPDQAGREMRQLGFDLLSFNGGIFSSVPMAMLSGLNPNPLSLFIHFFGLGIYSIGRLLLPFPSPNRFKMAARLILRASGILFPVIKAHGVRQTFFPATVPESRSLQQTYAVSSLLLQD